MELSSQDPSPIALDLSKKCAKNFLNPGSAEAVDLVKEPSWYSRHTRSHNTVPDFTQNKTDCLVSNPMQILSDQTLPDSTGRPPYGTRSSSLSSHNPLSFQLMDNSKGVKAGFMQLNTGLDGGFYCRGEPGSDNCSRHTDMTFDQGSGLDLLGLHNGMDSRLEEDSELSETDPTESPIAESIDGEESQCGSDVIFLVSTTKDTLITQDYSNTCSSLDRECVSPLVDPLSPADASMDERKGCFLLPQKMSSPSPDNTFSEDSSDSAGEVLVHAKPVLHLSKLAAVYVKSVSSPVDISSDDSDVIEVPVTNEKRKIHSFPILKKRRRLDETVVKKKTHSPQPRGVRRGASPQKSIPLMHKPTNSVCQRNSKIHTKNSNTSSHRCGSADMVDTKAKSCSSEKSWLLPAVMQIVDSGDSDMDSQTSRQRPLKSQSSSKSPQRESSPASHMADIKQVPSKLPSPRSKELQTKQKTLTKQPVAPTGSKAAANKTNLTRRRRKKHKQAGSSSMFSPEEPEIKLKYANYKVEKRENKSDNFCPFVHMERREFSACTVINYQEEEEDVGRNRGHQQTVSLSGVVPRTSCFRLGRLSSESKCQPLQVCCLCGGSANATGLGDLHGPYYPTGQALEEQCKLQAQREQNCSKLSADSQKYGQVGDNGLHGLSNGHSVEATDEDCILVSDCENSTLPFVKKPKENCSVDDCHKPTVMPHNTNERWIHEDCGIWSTGVFLVKGKLYGLEEAVRLAQETVCSTCQRAGATMGCFLKGCPNKYHYRCAVQSGCVLNEENFSMTCPKHKNKPFRGVNRLNNR